MSTLNTVSSANRTHIGFFGRMNAGKSSLLNSFVSQDTAIVSSTPGTTTDVVKKPMEIHGIGPCVLLDTAGFDDAGDLGKARVAASEKAAASCDLAVIVMDGSQTDLEKKWIASFREKKVAVCAVLTHAEEMSSEAREEKIAALEKDLHVPTVACSALTHDGGDELRKVMIGLLKGKGPSTSVTAGLVHAGDTVMQVMPQDPQAPQGRLIQPEVMTIRDCLDKDCITICVTPEKMEAALSNMKELPSLIITDSQAFREVYEKCPKECRLTSFSVLMAGLKGDIRYYAESAAAIDGLNENSKVLIAECCTHAPMEEDIGRVKIPRLLKKKVGQGLTVDVKAGTDFPADASDYDLIIQCGGCMFNRRYIMNRIDRAKEVNVPMTNYGIAIAYLNGILEHVTLPEGEA